MYHLKVAYKLCPFSPEKDLHIKAHSNKYILSSIKARNAISMRMSLGLNRNRTPIEIFADLPVTSRIIFDAVPQR